MKRTTTSLSMLCSTSKRRKLSYPMSNLQPTDIPASKEPLADKPIKSLEPDQAPKIPRKPKKEPAQESNGVNMDGDASAKDLKRAREDEGDLPPPSKKTKTSGADDDEVVLVGDEPSTGAIVIDD